MGKPWYDFHSVREGSMAVWNMLKGSGQLGDVYQDMIGFRRLCARLDPYPPVNAALVELSEFSGTHFSLLGPSAHPPTAFLFTAPIAFLPVSLAGTIWAMLCLILIDVSLVCYGLKWKMALGVSIIITILFPAIAASFTQITAFWVVGVALAYRYRIQQPFWSGVGIGMASLTKWLPLGIIGYFLFMRKYAAALGTLAVLLVAISIVLALEPAAFLRYVQVNRTESWVHIMRLENDSVFTQAYIRFKYVGLLGISAYAGLLLWRNRKSLYAPGFTLDYSFFLYSFLAVLFLPICWSASLMPLLPVLAYFVLRGRLAHVLLALICLAAMAMFNVNFFRLFIPRFPLGTTAILITSVLFLMEPPADSATAPIQRGGVEHEDAERRRRGDTILRASALKTHSSLH